MYENIFDEKPLSLIETLSDFEFEEDEMDEEMIDDGDDGIDDELEEGDYTTDDYCRWYQYGKLVLKLKPEQDHCKEVRAHMQRENFFPNAFFMSDHGNPVLIDLNK